MENLTGESMKSEKRTKKAKKSNVDEEVDKLLASLKALTDDYTNSSEYIPKAEVAAIMGVTLRKLENYTKQGKIKKYPIGKTACYMRHDVIELVQNNWIDKNSHQVIQFSRVLI